MYWSKLAFCLQKLQKRDRNRRIIRIFIQHMASKEIVLAQYIDASIEFE